MEYIIFGGLEMIPRPAEQGKGTNGGLGSSFDGKEGEKEPTGARGRACGLRRAVEFANVWFTLEEKAR
ncbi:uncharacterized protein N7482_007747 [Penicillium canariense]|uniref:Uncharacterized protein n=1 Tax=Penicillium canariense TaxID=189055 RepID=A0A9W9LKK2_9EURO|nr:uncharacterized protein N7482_007747 [Penicillium canariense]KAJ5160743.1 hypothetical protein N7482_007747 [Penicillium canariense]